jgi:hypothetical protein
LASNRYAVTKSWTSSPSEDTWAYTTEEGSTVYVVLERQEVKKLHPYLSQRVQTGKQKMEKQSFSSEHEGHLKRGLASGFCGISIFILFSC